MVTCGGVATDTQRCPNQLGKHPKDMRGDTGQMLVQGAQNTRGIGCVLSKVGGANGSEGGDVWPVVGP
jgi:hypothetical protein